jgi:hypothetical protein
MDKTTHVYISKRIVILYGALAVILIPWIFDLAENLPAKHLARHWDVVWVGFDLIMLVTLALTVIFALKKMLWVVLSATALATLFIVDAWFDILTSKPGREQRVAIFFGFFEVILAVFTLRMVHHVVRHTSPQQRNVKLTTKHHSEA